MTYQPHYIASYEDESGYHTYFEPFLAPEKAFPVLEDAYCWRARVKRNRGYNLLGRLRRALVALPIGNIGFAFAGVWTVNIFTMMGIVATEPNAQIQPGSVANPLVLNIAAPIGQTLTDNTGTGILVPSAGVITSATINYTTGDVVMTTAGAGAASATTFTGAYYPGLPVMGLRSQELPAINAEDTIAFDQKYAYKYDATTRSFLELVIGTTWQGTNRHFFYSTNYWNNANGSLFWATNTYMAGAASDPIRYFDTVAWTNFVPIIFVDAGGLNNYLYNAEIILPYKGRLLFLNTWEGPGFANPPGIPLPGVPAYANAVNFPRRVRYSQQGSPIDVAAFRTDQIGRGGFIDCPSPNEVIVGAEFLKDTLIIKFERSSWKLVYTGNEILPFVFQQINKSLGSESKYSLVPFDEGILSVANYGITIDDSVNVERIDLQIPNTIFQFQNTSEGTVRVHGIRDFYDELVYWTYVKSKATLVGINPEFVFPNRVLVYNYRNKTYAIFKDSFTTYGYFQDVRDKVWAELTYFTWHEWTAAWNTGVLSALFPSIVAGTQHGFVEILNNDGSNVGNDPSLFIKAINFAVSPVVFNIPNHNLETDDIVKITGIVDNLGTSPSILNDLTYQVIRVDQDNINLNYYLISPEGFYPLEGLVSNLNVYIGGGLITKINKFNISTKIFAPFYDAAAQCRVGYIDFLTDKTDNGEFTSSIYINENNTESQTDSDSFTSLLGTNIVNTRPENLTLIPSQVDQEKIWHRQYVQAVAQNFQVNMTLTPFQNANQSINEEDFVLHAMAFYISKNARLIQ